MRTFFSCFLLFFNDIFKNIHIHKKRTLGLTSSILYLLWLKRQRPTLPHLTLNQISMKRLHVYSSTKKRLKLSVDFQISIQIYKLPIANPRTSNLIPSHLLGCRSTEYGTLIESTPLISGDYLQQ